MCLKLKIIFNKSFTNVGFKCRIISTFDTPEIRHFPEFFFDNRLNERLEKN